MNFFDTLREQRTENREFYKNYDWSNDDYTIGSLLSYPYFNEQLFQ